MGPADAPAASVVVGSGEAGVRAAMTLREQGFHGRLTPVDSEGREPCERPPFPKLVLLGPDAVPPSRSGARDLRARDVTVVQVRRSPSIALRGGPCSRTGANWPTSPCCWRPHPATPIKGLLRAG